MSPTIKRNLVLLPLVAIGISLHAQIEVAHLKAKNISSTGFGAFLNFALPISEGGSITLEGAFYYFKEGDNNIALVPLIAGYRHTFDGTGTGFYAEPTAGYNIGATDIEKVDQLGQPIPDGNGGWVEQQVKGPVAGLTVGYILPGNTPINFGLRFQHVFVSKDPTLNVYSLRISWPFRFGRRE